MLPGGTRMEKSSLGARSRGSRRHYHTMIPREFVPLLDQFPLDADARIQLWTFALVLLMIDQEQVRMIGTREVAGREWFMLQIYGGEEFEILRPELSEQDELHLLEGVRAIVQKTRVQRRRLNLRRSAHQSGFESTKF